MFEWSYFFAQFGFNAVMARKGEDYKTIPAAVDEFISRGILYCGSPDTVNRQLEAALKVMPVDYLWLFTANELLAQPKMMRNLELMSTKVFPNFTDKIGPAAQRKAA